MLQLEGTLANSQQRNVAIHLCMIDDCAPTESKWLAWHYEWRRSMQHSVQQYMPPTRPKSSLLPYELRILKLELDTHMLRVNGDCEHCKGGTFPHAGCYHYWGQHWMLFYAGASGMAAQDVERSFGQGVCLKNSAWGDALMGAIAAERRTLRRLFALFISNDSAQSSVRELLLCITVAARMHRVGLVRWLMKKLPSAPVKDGVGLSNYCDCAVRLLRKSGRCAALLLAENAAFSASFAASASRPFASPHSSFRGELPLLRNITLRLRFPRAHVTHRRRQTMGERAYAKTAWGRRLQAQLNALCCCISHLQG